MKIYIDSGNLEEIKKAVETGLIDGVTTNPTLVKKEGMQFHELIKKIILIFKQNHISEFTVSAEVSGNSVEDIVKEAKIISEIDSHVIIKIPLTKEGLKAVRTLCDFNIRTNVTLCFSANQALLAAKAGAYIVSPFEGRLDDIGEDGTRLISEIRKIYDNYNFKTMILAASIRSPKQVKEAAMIGSDIITIPFSVFDKLFLDPLTELGIKQFEYDWKEHIKGVEK